MEVVAGRTHTYAISDKRKDALGMIAVVLILLAVMLGTHKRDGSEPSPVGVEDLGTWR